MSSPEKLTENDENTPKEMTESKTPKQSRQGKRVPTESPYSWATPSHRKPLKQSRQPVFVADENLEQTFVEQDTIMMFHRNATFNESCDFENISQNEPAASQEASENVVVFPDIQETELDSESNLEMVPDREDHEHDGNEAGVNDSSMLNEKSLREDGELPLIEGGDMSVEQEEISEEQSLFSSETLDDQVPVSQSLEEEFAQTVDNNHLHSETEVPTALEISGNVEGNSLADELNAIVLSTDSPSFSENLSSTTTDYVDEVSQEVSNVVDTENTDSMSDESDSSTNVNENSLSNSATVSSEGSPKDVVNDTEDNSQLILNSSRSQDVNDENTTAEDIENKSYQGETEEEVVCENKLEISSIAGEESEEICGSTEALATDSDHAEALDLATETEFAQSEVMENIVEQEATSVDAEEELMAEGSSLAAELDELRPEVNEVESESSSSEPAELAALDNTENVNCDVAIAETGCDDEMVEDEGRLGLESEIESTEAVPNLSSEEMDEFNSDSVVHNQMTFTEKTFVKSTEADFADSTCSTSRDISEIYGADISDAVQNSELQPPRKSYVDISAIRPEEDPNISGESEARDQFDENASMQTFTTPAKGQFSDSMVEFVMLENNFSLETENELREQVARLRASMVEMAERIESLTSQNLELNTIINTQLTERNDDQTFELTRTNISLLEKNAELETVIKGLRQEHNQEVENVTSKLINTTKELDSLRFDGRRNDSTLEIERNNELERMIEEMNVQNESLKKCLAEKNCRLVEMENDLSENKIELGLLQERLDSDTGFLTESLQQKKQQITSLQREIEDCRLKATDSETAVDELKNVLRGNMDPTDECEEDSRSFEEKCQFLKSEILSLKETVEQLKKTDVENSDQASETQKLIEDLKNELQCSKTMLENTREEFEKERNTYMESSSEKEKRADDLSSEAESLKAMLTELSETKEKLEGRVSSLEQELEDAKMTSQIQENGLSTAIKENEDLKKDIEAKELVLTELQIKDEELTGQLESLKTELKTKEDDFTQRINDLESQIVNKETEFKEEVDGLKNELLSKNTLTEEIESLKLELEAKNNELKEQTTALESMESLKSELEEVKKNSSSLEEENVSLTSRIAVVDDVLSQHISKLAEIQESNSTLNESLQQLQEKYDMIVKNSEEAAAVLKLKEEELAETVPKLRKELTDVTVIVVELETKLVESLGKNSTLEEELFKIKENSVSQETEHEKTKVLVIEAQEKLSDLGNQLKEANRLLLEANEKSLFDQKALEDLQSEYQSSKTLLEENSEMMKQKEEEIQRLAVLDETRRKEMEEGISKFAEMEEYTEKVKTELAQMKSELDDERLKSVTIANEYEVFRLKLEELKGTLSLKEEQLKEVERTSVEANELRMELTNEQERLASAQAKISQFENMVSRGEVELNNLLQENSSLKTVVDGAKTENQALFEKINQLEEEKANLLSAINDNSKLEEKEKVIYELSSEKRGMEEKLKTLNGDFERMEDKLTTLTVDLTNEKCKTESLMDELKELKAERDTLLSTQSSSAIGDVDVNSLKEEFEATKQKVSELEEKCSSQDNEVERLYKMCDEFDDIESELKQTIAEQDEEILALKKKCGDAPQEERTGLLDVLKKGVKPLTPNTSINKQETNSDVIAEEDEDMEEGEGFTSAPSSPTKNKGSDNNVTMSTTMSSTMYKRIHSDQTIKSPSKDVNSSRCAQQ